MNTKMIPAIISLLAGLVAVIVTYISKAELVEILTTLFAVLLSFYILGCIIRAVINKFAGEELQDGEEEEDSQQDLENIETTEEE